MLSFKKSCVAFFAVALFLPLFFSCASVPSDGAASSGEIEKRPVGETQAAASKTAEPEAVSDSRITLLFAGDVMAHATNYRPGKFDRIWRDVAPLVKSADLAFANIEAPVSDTIPWNTYPQFNMHSEYVEAAIDAGFNVFSLANNHTNDQLLQGIKDTKKYFDSRAGIWACGLKDKPSDPISHKIIEKNGFKILFVAITELLNRVDASSYIDYYPSTQKKRAQLSSELKALQEKSGCDLFVLSVHTDEPEYVLSVTDGRKKFYRDLIENCKVDIVWANHPHVVKGYEEVEPSTSYAEQPGRKAFIMYANGNVISAQRQEPSFKKPETDWDNTGDGLFLRMELKKTADGKITIEKTEPFLITTYIAPSRQFVIKLLDDSFLDALDRAELSDWASYLRARRDIVNKRIGESEN